MPSFRDHREKMPIAWTSTLSPPVLRLLAWLCKQPHRSLRLHHPVLCLSISSVDRGVAKSRAVLEQEDDCFEHGYPETLLQFHGVSMRNIPTKEAEVRWKYMFVPGLEDAARGRPLRCRLWKPTARCALDMPSSALGGTIEIRVTTSLRRHECAADL